MHKLLRRYLFITASILMLCGVIAPEKADALGWPHNAVGSCSSCHSGGFEDGLFDFTPNCLNCHDSASVDPNAGDAKLLPFALNDAAQPTFGKFTAVATPKQISHAWGVPFNNITAGTSKVGDERISGRSTTVSCGSCHWPHASYYPKALRLPTDDSAFSLQRNALCVTCHSSRNVTKASGNVAPKKNSHPVNVQFTDIEAHTYPPNIDAAYSSISSSVLRLFSTVGGKDTVHCKTCHGVHYTDSNPYTEDVAPKYPAFTGMSTGDGYLLRRYNDSTMCNDCHNYQGHGKSGNVMTCRNCHKPHNVGNNVNLVMQNISTPLINANTYGNATAFKLYTARGFVTDNRDGTGICEVCHSLRTDSPSGDPVFRRWSTNHSGRNGLVISQASQFDCMGCHPHQVGVGMNSFMPGGGACSVCHGQPPQKNYTGTVVDGGYAWLSATGKGYADTGVFKNESTTPHKTHAVEYSFGDKGSAYGTGAADGKCRACHNNSDSLHQQGTFADGNFQNVNFGLHSTLGQIGGYNTGSGVCSNLYCHSNGNPWNGSISYTDPTWESGYTETNCNSCHANPPATNVHAKHTDAPYSLDCAYCHNNTVTNYSTITAAGKSTYHVNKVKDVAFSGPATAKGASPNFDSANHKCSDVWCHGNQAGIMNNITVVWNGSAMTCSSCHENPNTSSSHDKHVSTYSFTCERCHDYRMTGNSMGNYTGHVDGTKDVDFDNSGGIDNTGGAAYVDGTDECDNIYCHSRGTDLVAPFNTSTSQPMSVATWGGTATCNYCHGNSTYSGYTAAMPNYASGSPKANSHSKHVVDNGFGCKVCHDTTLTDNWTIGSTVLHVNMTRDVSIVSAYGATATWDGGTGKCSNVTCHGSNNSPAWGVAAYCTDCHYSQSSSDEDDDTTWNNFSGAAAKIYSSDFKDTGHGKPSGSYDYTNLPAANKACTDCHDEPVKHGNATIPFRTKWSGDLDTFCLSCHGAGAQLQGAFATRSGIQNHSYFNISTNGYKNLTTWRFAPKCVDCHDPHGDSNLGMIHDKVQTGGSDAEGRPAAYVNGSTVVFTKFTGGVGSFSAATIDQTSVCRACHSRTKYHKIDGGIEHNSNINCLNCHKHETGFTPAGCNLGCHGYPPRDAAQLLYSSANADTSTTQTGSVTAGAHQTHVEYAGQVCDNCHDGGMATTQLESAQIDLDIEAYGVYTTGSYDGQAAVAGGSYPYAGAGAGGAGGSKVCSNVKCHGDGGWLSDGANHTPQWDLASTGDCGNCHAAKKASKTGVGSSGNGYPTTNAHAKHAGWAAGQYDFMCKTCHNATVLGTATTLAATHVDAQAEVDFDAADSRLDASPTYDGDATVNSGFGTDGCINTYCHSRAHSTTQPYSSPNIKLAWDGASSTCNTCHGSTGVYSGYTAAVPNYASGSPKVNSHIEHVVDNGINCSSCHYDTTTDGRTINNVTSHVNKQYDVVVPYDAGSDNNYSSPTCASVDCHQSVSVDWGGATPGCTTCHSTGSDTDNFVFNSFSSPNTVAAKINSTEWTATGHGTTGAGALKSGNNGPNLVCDDCHDDGTSTNHGEAGKYFRLDDADTDTLCLSCHGSGAALTGGAKIGNVTGIQSHTYDNMTGGYKTGMDPWNFTPKCVDCHDPHGDKNRYMIHTYVGYSGSDGEGRPSKYDVLSNFSTVGGGLMNWSSYVNVSGGAGKGLCQRCHGARVNNFDKGGEFNQTHNNGQRCTACHDHKKGFTPSGACQDCHYDTADVDDFTFGNAPAGQAKINQTQYTSVGHGKDSIALDCLHCHDDTIAHNTSGRYFRLYTSDTNALCAGCHGDTGAGTYQAWTSGVDGWVVATKTGIFTHSTTVMQTGRGHKVQVKCVDCHDPHGDNNIFMVHSTVSVPNDTDGTASDIYGIPTETLQNVDFTANNYTSDYAVKSAADKVCQRCHNQTTDVPDTGETRYRQTGTTDIAHGTDKCTGCHSHANGFKGLACNDCHGMPPTDAPDTILGGAGNNASEPASGVSGAGAHKAHTDAMGATTDVCSRCHNSGMWGTGAKNTTIDLEFKAFNLYTGNNQDYTGSAGVNGGNYDYAGQGYSGGDTQQCDNMKCHGATTSWLTGGSATPPNWFTPSTGACGDCHGVKKNPGDASSWPTTGAHIKHVTNTTYDLMCVTCHSATIISNHTTLNDLNHVNGKSTVQLDTSNSRVEGTGNYVNEGVNDGVYEDCENTYCHSQGTALVSGFTAPKVLLNWDQTDTCGSCHAGTATGPDYSPGSPKANSHDTHVVTKGFVCSYCHQATTTDNATISNESLHVNQFYNISVDAAYAVGAGLKRYSSVTDGSGGTCKNVYCHGAAMGAGATGLDITPQWGDTTTAECGDCHLTDTTSPKITQGGHQMHVGGTPTYYGFLCSNCHTSDAAATHVDGTRTFIGDVDLSATAACAACHSGDAAEAKFDWYSTTKTRTCGEAASCHPGRADAGNMPISHSKHLDPTTYDTTFKCAYCHNHTVAVGSDTAINDRTNHANTVKDVYFNSFQNNSTDGSIDGAKVCSDIYCHSNGTDLVGPYTDANDDPRLAPDWDAPTALNCNGCHGSTAYGDWRDAMPNYADGSPKNNSHVEHVVNNGIPCTACHGVTLSANNTIGDYTKHINGAYDVDIDAKYAGSYAGGTCTSVTCHGGNSVNWGDATVTCSNCHSTTADTDDFTWTNITSASMSMAKISLKQYTSVGHGRDSGTSYPKSGNAGAGKVCTNCHDGAVNHGTATNPFRLTNADTVAFCNNASCHPSSSITHHDTSTTDGRWGFGMKCVDCHDPHGDNNIFMVHSTIAAPNQPLHGYTSSDQYGTPFSDLATYNVDFTNNAAGSDYGDKTQANGLTKICNVCHTRTDQGSGKRYNRDQGAAAPDTHNWDQLCVNCHKHPSGFEGGGESGGGSACGGCHSSLFETMTSASSYHHYMENADATYSNATSLTTTDTRRRCLMCHVDHDVFSPGVPGQQLGRAMNLLQTPRPLANVSGINTDFFPANPKYDAVTNPVSGGSTGANGICIGCHNTVKFKNISSRGASDGSTKARGFSKYLFYSSSHNFQILEGMSLYSSIENSNGGSGSSFRANCSKCHGSYAFNKNVQNNGAREKFGLHDTKYQSLNRAMNNATTVANPMSKRLCYNCHGKGVRTSYDYYSTIEMNSGAKLIETAIESKSYGHPAGALPGHDPSEYYDAAVGWLGADGENRHVECTDCHNTHGGNANIKRAQATPAGNGIAGAQKGVWGVDITSFPGNGLTIPSGNFSKVDQITKQWQLCAKCHSKFAWGDDQGSIAPSQGNAAISNYTVYLTDVMREFNTNNNGYHPVVAAGANQPGVGLNPNWPAGANIKYYDPFQGITSTEWVEGLSYAMIPPFTTDDTLGCTDCHKADTTGKVVNGAIYQSTLIAGTWTNGGNIIDVDGATATSQADGSVFRFDVGGASFTPPATFQFVATGYSNGKSKLLNFKVYSSTVAIAGATGTLTMPQNAAGKKAANITLGISSAASMNDNVYVEIWDNAANVFNIDKAAIEATYTMSETLRGPHGSMMQWILASANKDIRVDWSGNGTFENNANEYPNNNIGAGTAEERIFCFNCHRRDVYEIASGADTATNKYSRFKHWQLSTGGGPTTYEAAALDNKWGIACMTCHGGGKSGAIHGDWQVDWEGYTGLDRPVSARLLNGAGAHLEADFITSGTAGMNCYINGGSPLGSCSTSHTPKNIPYASAYNYDYTAY